MKVVCIDDKDYRPHWGDIPADAPKKGEILTVKHIEGNYYGFYEKSFDPFVGYNKRRFKEIGDMDINKAIQIVKNESMIRRQWRMYLDARIAYRDAANVVHIDVVYSGDIETAKTHVSARRLQGV